MGNPLRIAVLGLVFLFASIAAQAKPLRYELAVDGLACPFCAYGIEKELIRMEGVATIAIDINAGIVMVTMNEGASMTEAKADRIVKDAGFSLRAFDEVRPVAGNK